MEDEQRKLREEEKIPCRSRTQERQQEDIIEQEKDEDKRELRMGNTVMLIEDSMDY